MVDCCALCNPHYNPRAEFINLFDSIPQIFINPLSFVAPNLENIDDPEVQVGVAIYIVINFTFVYFCMFQLRVIHNLQCILLIFFQLKLYYYPFFVSLDIFSLNISFRFIISGYNLPTINRYKLKLSIEHNATCYRIIFVKILHITIDFYLVSQSHRMTVAILAIFATQYNRFVRYFLLQIPNVTFTIQTDRTFILRDE